MQKLYSTPQAIAYLERRPDAVFEWTDPKPSHWSSDGVNRLLIKYDYVVCVNRAGVWVQSIPRAARWILVSPKPKRERVRLGRFVIERGRVHESTVGLLHASDGSWTVYAVKVER